jgi:hypothetical protein
MKFVITESAAELQQTLDLYEGRLEALCAQLAATPSASRESLYRRLALVALTCWDLRGELAQVTEAARLEHVAQAMEAGGRRSLVARQAADAFARAMGL